MDKLCEEGLRHIKMKGIGEAAEKNMSKIIEALKA